MCFNKMGLDSIHPIAISLFLKLAAAGKGLRHYFQRKCTVSAQLLRGAQVSGRRVHSAVLGTRPQSSRSSTNTLWHKQGLGREI